MINKRTLNQINRITDFFVTELSTVEKEYMKSKEDKRFFLNIQILLLSSFMILISALIQTFLSDTVFMSSTNIIQSIQIILGLIAFIVIYFIFNYIFSDWNEYKKVLDRKTGLEMIIKFLIQLKLCQIKEKDLIELINRIKIDFRDYRETKISNKREYYVFQKERINEYLRILDNINYTIIQREKERSKSYNQN